MSWKTFLFLASTCTVASPFHLSAREPSSIEPSSTPPVIISLNDDQWHNVHDRFIVNKRYEKRRMESLRSLFPHIDETATTNRYAPLKPKLVESKRVTQRQATTKPKLTVVVGSEPKFEEFVDDVDSEDPVKTPSTSMHRGHHHNHHHHNHDHNHHVTRHNHDVDRHHNRRQDRIKKRRYGRTATMRMR